LSWEELGKTQIKIDPSQNAVQLTGSILAQDSEGGSVPLTVEKDDQGNAVLRIIDSAPWAYDPILEANKVIVLGDRKLFCETIKKKMYWQIKTIPVIQTIIIATLYRSNRLQGKYGK